MNKPYKERTYKKGSKQLVWENGKAKFIDIPTKWSVRKATKKEAREFMKQVREAGGLARIGR